MTFALENDTTAKTAPNKITINNRISTEQTVKQLTGEIPYMSKITKEMIQNIFNDKRLKYKNIKFPDDYYIKCGEDLVYCGARCFGDYGHALDSVAVLIDSSKKFDNGKGSPFFHVYENVVRGNDDTGIDKLLHFIYSAKNAYHYGYNNSYIKGFAKELIKDELWSYFTNTDNKKYQNMRYRQDE